MLKRETLSGVSLFCPLPAARFPFPARALHFASSGKGCFAPTGAGLSPTGHFLSLKKVTKERLKGKGIPISPFP